MAAKIRKYIVWNLVSQQRVQKSAQTRKLLRDETDDDPFTDSENESEEELESSSSSDEVSFESSDKGELYGRDVEQGSAGFPITV